MGAELGLVHTVISTRPNVHDVKVSEIWPHAEKTDVYTGAGYKGIEKRCKADAVRWHDAQGFAQSPTRPEIEAASLSKRRPARRKNRAINVPTYSEG